ncbi:UNVERIFIED_CONTAM: hypothetical protein Slati_2860900 [Sesamum latifolium]|uniref:Uncharacterized protein n=1 Tax=Sesamum latifolium TaxID=2727402 RepID=A0AAW2VBP7_9LAMI
MAKRSSRQGLREHVCNLLLTGNVARKNETLFEVITNQVTIDVKMLGSFVKYGIFSDVDGSLIVTMEGNRRGHRNTKLTQKIANPKQFTNGGPHTPILSLGRRTRNRRLFLHFPKDQGTA